MKYLIELTFSGFFSYKVNIMDLPTWPEGKLGHYKSVKELIADGIGPVKLFNFVDKDSIGMKDTDESDLLPF